MLPGKPSLGETANEFGELRGQTGEQTGAPKSGDRIILFWPEGDQHLLSAGDARTLCRIRPTKISLLVVRAPSLGIRRALHAVVSARFGVWPLATASGPRLCVASAGAGKAVGPSMPIAQQISLAIDHAFDERAVIVRSQGPKFERFLRPAPPHRRPPVTCRLRSVGKKLSRRRPRPFLSHRCPALRPTPQDYPIRSPSCPPGVVARPRHCRIFRQL